MVLPPTRGPHPGKARYVPVPPQPPSRPYPAEKPATPSSRQQKNVVTAYKSEFRQSHAVREPVQAVDTSSGQDRVESDEADESFNLAAVDMGSNSFSLIIVKTDAQGRYQVLDSMKEEVALLSGGTRFNIITEEAESRALSTMKRLRQVAETRGAQLRTVATSAIREARNGGALVRHMRDQVGVSVEVISGQEEARLIYLGVLQALPLFDSVALCIDIGGGSTEIVMGRQGRTLSASSVKLGHLRCVDACFPTLAKTGRIDLKEVQECRSMTHAILADAGIKAEVAAQRKAAAAAGVEFVAVGTSGNITTIANMIAARRAYDSDSACAATAAAAAAAAPGASPPSSRLWRGDLARGAAAAGGTCQEPFQGLEFTKEELHQLVVDLLEATTYEERARWEGLKKKRINTIVAGAVVLQELFILCDIDRMRVSHFALREGLIADTIARMLPRSHTNLVADPRSSSIKHLAKRFNLLNHAASSKHVSTLAHQLLRGLQSSPYVHPRVSSLTANDAFLLGAAASVHHVGMFLSHSKCHDHAYYIIKNDSHLLGFTPLELEMVALMAKFHRKAYPDPKKHPEVAALPPEMQQKLKVMVAILRVALALDRSRTASSVQSVTVEQDESGAVILVDPAPIEQPRDSATADALLSYDSLSVQQDLHIHDISVELWAARQELEYLSELLETPFKIFEGGFATAVDLPSISDTPDPPSDVNAFAYAQGHTNGAFAHGSTNGSAAMDASSQHTSQATDRGATRAASKGAHRSEAVVREAAAVESYVKLVVVDDDEVREPPYAQGPFSATDRSEGDAAKVAAARNGRGILELVAAQSGVVVPCEKLQQPAASTVSRPHEVAVGARQEPIGASAAAPAPRESSNGAAPRRTPPSKPAPAMAASAGSSPAPLATGNGSSPAKQPVQPPGMQISGNMSPLNAMEERSAAHGAPTRPPSGNGAAARLNVSNGVKSRPHISNGAGHGAGVRRKRPEPSADSRAVSVDVVPGDARTAQSALQARRSLEKIAAKGKLQREGAARSTGHVEWRMSTDTDGHVQEAPGQGNGLLDCDSILGVDGSKLSLSDFE